MANAYRATFEVPLVSGIRQGSGLINPIWASQSRMSMRDGLAWANRVSQFIYNSLCHGGLLQVLWLQGFAYSPPSNQRVSIAAPAHPPVLAPLVLSHQKLYKVFTARVLGEGGPPLSPWQTDPSVGYPLLPSPFDLSASTWKTAHFLLFFCDTMTGKCTMYLYKTKKQLCFVPTQKFGFSN